jgi:Na+/H+ antiporter NhaA
MHSCAFSLVVNQALIVLLAYTLVQVHLALRQRQELNRGLWEYTRQLLSPALGSGGGLLSPAFLFVHLG